MINNRLISFEGIDYSGKTTQIEFLKHRLKRHNIDPIIYREPGATGLGEKIREILLHSKSSDFEISEKSEILLYATARSQLVEQLKKDLKDGKYVILDRYIDSTIAYQGYGSNIAEYSELRAKLKFLEMLEDYITESTFVPIKTFLIHIDVNTYELRKFGTVMDRIEARGRDYFKRVINGYELISSNSRFINLDGSQSIENIHKKIWKEIVKIWKINE